jgi:hypothetical protein
MGKKNHQKAIRSLNKRIAEHQEKITLEFEILTGLKVR